MEENFQTKTVNGMGVRFWRNASQRGRSEARKLASRLPRGGKIDDGTIRHINAPVQAGATVEVWLEGDGYSFFTPPEGYEITGVDAFDTSGVCINLQKSE